MAIADQENNSTLGRVVSGSVEAVNPKVVRPASPASKGNDNCRIEEFKDDHSDSMEYAWLEPRGHDPIATDTNLAEIDFENFRNEDLAYAFSCGEEESGSSTDMSVCRSEPLFSSMRDSEMQSELNPVSTAKDHHRGVLVDGERCGQGAAALANVGHAHVGQDSLIQDSLTDEDFNFGEKVTVNKNNYTLTFSGQGVISSFIASMVSSTGANLEPAETSGSSPLSCGRFERSLESPGKLTTWSNLGSKSPSSYQQSPPTPVIWQSRNREELNNNGDNESRKTKSLPEFECQQAAQAPQDPGVEATDARLVNAFIRGRGIGGQVESKEMYNNDDPGIPMMRSKDTVNQFLKTNSRLTSIEEQAEGGYTSSSTSNNSTDVNSSSGTTLKNNSSNSTPKNRPLTLPKPHNIKVLRKCKSLSSSNSVTSTSTTSKYAYPDLDFLENDVGLWDAFFSHGKNAKFQSVLKPPLPMDEYLKKCNEPKKIETPPPVQQPPASRNPALYDTASLKALLPAAQKHLVSSGSGSERFSSPISQVCQSLSKINLQPSLERSYVKNDIEDQIKIKTAWPSTSSPEAVEVVRRRKKSEASADTNLNLINNNGSSTEDMSLKRRSYHPQDYLSKVLQPETRHTVPGLLPASAASKRRDFPKSGSQNDLVDSWRSEEDDSAATNTTTSDAVSAANARWNIPSQRNLSAEYPFHKNLCMPPQGINFDLTHKRGLFVNLYSAVERFLMYQDDNATSVRYILFHELCPALIAIMKDGLKPEVITSFGKMQTNVWRVVEALIRQGPSFGGGGATSDLVMLLNAKFPAVGEDHRKFFGFVAGLLNMSSLHVWFSKLKWSMDVLLRFYERHAFICALHKETRLLFDELIFCLQRLYSVPLHIDLPFSNDILDDIPSTPVSTPTTHHSVSSPASTCCSRGSFGTYSGSGGHCSSHSQTHSSCSNCSISNTIKRRPNSGKSRIPRPISLPKRLESKLSASPSPSRGTVKVKNSPITGPVRPTSSHDRKSRVRDAVKLFDSKTEGPTTATASAVATATTSTGGERGERGSTTRRGSSANARKVSAKSPKTGAGEAMALEDTGGRPR